ncbi:MAG: TonB-dependent receptor plug domain-containing protein [Ignavibacteriales bacterium]|nr:TonB-dependent receptor plug domain-containing protein [Ignavibacteriales bacterium]
MAEKDTSKVKLQDTTKVVRKKIEVVSVTPLLENSESGEILRKKNLDVTDYRYTGNFFTNIPFGFSRDLGTIGQPNEILIYGQGFNNLSFLNDGIEINNRLQNSFDVNLFQSEGIDSIEIIPLARGFLYGMSNPANVNFISRDFYTARPYSRIKFYQAPNDEGFVDGIFSSNFGERLSTFFEITNQGTEPRYLNTGYSAWIGTARFRYLISNTLTLSASYNYSQSYQELFGGVDADAIAADQFEEELYNNISAPISFSTRYQKTRTHNFLLRGLARIDEENLFDLSFYSQANLTEYRQNEYELSSQINAAKIVNNNRYETYGTRFSYTFTNNFLDFSIISTFENQKLRSYAHLRKSDISFFSSAGKLSLFPKSNFISASLFGKYLNYDGEDNFGLGVDGQIILTDNIKLYSGFSSFEKPNSHYEYIPTATIADDISTDGQTNGKQTNNAFELKTSYTSDFISLSAGYFYLFEKDKLIAAIVNQDTLLSDQAVYFKKSDNTLHGINLKLDLRFWKFLFSTSTNYYFNESCRKKLALPEFTSSGGIYYIDTLFNDNLKLKTGINYSTVGSRNQIYFDSQKSISTPYIVENYYTGTIINSFDNYSPEFQIDFFLSGKIQDRAIVYFVFENLLDTKYFIVPYYPKQPRGMRFGVAWEFLD